MIKILSLVAISAFVVSAHAVDISTCNVGTVVNGTFQPPATDVLTDVVNASSDYANKLGPKGTKALSDMTEVIIRNAPNCEAARVALKVLDDNFLVLFNVR